MIEKLMLNHSKVAGANCCDVNIFGDVAVDIQHNTLPGLVFSLPEDNPMTLLRDSLANMRCEPYSTYLSALRLAGASTEKSTQDAWHLHSAHVCGAQYFLTCDTNLLSHIGAINDRALRSALAEVVKLPTELCAELRVESLTEEGFDALIRVLVGFPPFEQSAEHNP